MSVQDNQPEIRLEVSRGEEPRDGLRLLAKLIARAHMSNTINRAPIKNKDKGKS